MGNKMKRIFSAVILALALVFLSVSPIFAVSGTYYSSTSDGFIRSSDSVYATARTATSGDYAFSETIGTFVSNTYFSPDYQVERGFLYFDTSSLYGYAVTAATLNVYVYGKGDTNGESIQVQSGMATYPHDPLVVGDFNLANYAGDGGSKDITTFTVGAYNSIALNATGYGWINTSGTTKYCLRTTGDINNVAPTGQNYISFYSSEYGTSYQPYLSVTYTALTPAIVAVDESDVSQTTARLNSLVTNDGGEGCQIRFGYGTTTQTAPNFESYDTRTTLADTYNKDDRPYLDVTGLVADTTYFYRVRITNSITTVTSDEITFDTTLAVADATKFMGKPYSTSISLTWVRGAGASTVLIRYSTATYPATNTDGTFLYTGDATTYLHSSLSDGTTYYYTIWGVSGATYSSVAGVNLVMTTESDYGSSSELPSGTNPSGWFQEPDESFLVNFQPFYSVINGLADSWGMPRGNMWLSLSLLLVMAAGLGTYIMWRAPAFSLMLMAFIMAGFVALHILPSMMIVLVAALALGAWGTRPQGI